MPRRKLSDQEDPDKIIKRMKDEARAERAAELKEKAAKAQSKGEAVKAYELRVRAKKKEFPEEMKEFERETKAIKKRGAAQQESKRLEKKGLAQKMKGKDVRSARTMARSQSALASAPQIIQGRTYAEDITVPAVPKKQRKASVRTATKKARAEKKK
jgi:hypothetical protein